ncbi:PhaM family polyhydroxyalkanoate granule multifunctional regulatory protein [Massilia endophytica]|uniref:PhaM family polyhydroxyalkanoate granule multifunctional regulatory protein n=1 Tax=Massilia endophytica TaxID=2899220 RepID=UPI001E2A55C2|nr:PhaM family polyhydroxyalkanoate granule multifunctional regulatory protein [Massilia endophytica]UGQ46866.1 hypothetical protein LSQ66_24415 [Massilia endophytica]
MSNPQMPPMPGATVMTDTLDFVKNLWGSMGVPGVSLPGIATPTLSVDELDKKINDLKAVEAWLNLNGTMLRSSIQALEVQRNTIATLKSMGQSFAASMQQPGKTDKSLFENNPYASAFFHQGETGNGADGPAKTEAPDPAAAAAGQMANPAAWWNMLQEQFTQAVNNAMAADTVKKPEPAKADEAPAKPKRTPKAPKQ